MGTLFNNLSYVSKEFAHFSFHANIRFFLVRRVKGMAS